MNALEIQTQYNLPWLKLDIELPYKEMYAEAKALKECFVPHRTLEHNKGWYSLCLHGLSSVHVGAHEKYNSKHPYVWTDIAKFCPVAHDFFHNHFGYTKYYRLRYMLLTPGGYVGLHNDDTIDRLNAINISLNQPKNCDFTMEKHGVVPFTEGSAMMLSLANNHKVENNSNEDRYHMIVHGIRDSNFWDELVVRSYVGAKAPT
jgi:Aspartyl/Asparaginyl beta-hydroxylase